jgi:hypothetical protein
MKNAVHWDVAPCGPCKKRLSEERITSIIKVTIIGELGTLAVTSNRITLQGNNANIVPSSPILVTLIIEVILSSETSVLTRVTLRNILEDGILHDLIFCSLRIFASDLKGNTIAPF